MVAQRRLLSHYASNSTSSDLEMESALRRLAAHIPFERNRPNGTRRILHRKRLNDCGTASSPRRRVWRNSAIPSLARPDAGPKGAWSLI
jgi:hypothetical protein